MTQEIIKIKLTRTHKRRLLALADLLDRVKEVRFDMIAYRYGGINQDELIEPECETTACAVGWATVVMKKFRANIPLNCLEVGGIHWANVCYWLGCFENSRMWGYLFSGQWRDTDNTPTGAAKRIRWVVAHNGIPTNWEAQMIGSAPLLYMEGQA